MIGENKKIVEVRIKDAEKVFKRIFSEGSLGLGESYCEGLINVSDEDYKEFLFIFVRTLYNKKLLLKLSLIDLLRIAKSKFIQRSFSHGNQKDDINGHYSLSDWFPNEMDSNIFYLYWLDSPYIQYTCGKWDEDTITVEEAQLNKLEFYARRLGINESSRGKTMLDLGCGWGGSMFFMAEKYGVISRGITLSKAQGKYIEEEAKR